MIAQLTGRQKLAALFFIVGKVHSVLAAVTMFINVPMAGVLLAVAAVCIGTSIALCCSEMNRRKETNAEWWDRMMKDPSFRAFVAQKLPDWPKQAGVMDLRNTL